MELVASLAVAIRDTCDTYMTDIPISHTTKDQFTNIKCKYELPIPVLSDRYYVRVYSENPENAYVSCKRQIIMSKCMWEVLQSSNVIEIACGRLCSAPGGGNP